MSRQSFVSPATRARARDLATPLARGLGRLGLTPNALTVGGFLGTAVAAYVASQQAWLAAGVLVLAFGIFDLFDGALARATGRATSFGAFLDSTLDRTGENLVYAGIAVGCAVGGYPLGVALAGLAMATSSIVTYARARAEALDLHGEVGIAPRSERLVVLSAGLVLCGLGGGLGPTPFPTEPPSAAGGSLALVAALTIIAAASAVTIVQRILHTKHQLDRQNPQT